MNKTVYNIMTGEAVTISGIDAREYLASGGWSQTPPEIEIQVIDEAETQTPIINKRKRKPKAGDLT